MLKSGQRFLPYLLAHGGDTEGTFAALVLFVVFRSENGGKKFPPILKISNSIRFKDPGLKGRGGGGGSHRYLTSLIYHRYVAPIMFI